MFGNKIKSILILVVVCILLVGMVGIMFKVFTPEKATDSNDNEVVKTFIATTEEEMNEFLVSENVGQVIKYTGETVKNVTLPFAIGDTITHLCMDTSVDIKDWVLGLDWENISFREVQEDGDVSEIIFVALRDGATFDYIKECIQNGTNLSEGGPFILIQHYRNAEGTDEFYLMGFGSTYAWVHDVNGNLGYDFEGWNKPSGDTGFPNVNIGDCVISDILPEYLAGDCLFFGPEEGNYGSVEVVFEKDVEYIVVADKDGGCHYEEYVNDNLN